MLNSPHKIPSQRIVHPNKEIYKKLHVKPKYKQSHINLNSLLLINKNK